MDHTLVLASRVPSGVWIAIVLFLIAHTLFFGRSRSRRERKDDGWNVLRPTLGFQLIGWLMAVMGGLSFYLLVMSAGFLMHWKRFEGLFGDPRLAMVLAALSAIAALWFFYAFLYIFIGRFRYNEKGLERDVPGSVSFHPWSDIAHLDRHWLLGPRFRLRSGKAFVVWDMYDGYDELIRYAAGRGLTLLAR